LPMLLEGWKSVWRFCCLCHRSRFTKRW